MILAMAFTLWATAATAMARAAQKTPPPKTTPQEPSQGQRLAHQDRRIEILRGKPEFHRLPQPEYTIRNGAIKYGPTTLSADLITIYPAPDSALLTPDAKPDALPTNKSGPLLGTGFAEGHVLVTDPMGTVTCVRLDFDWKDRTGKAQSAKIVVPDLTLNAESAAADANQLTFTHVHAKQGGIFGGISLNADRLVIKPGDAATVYGGALLSGSKPFLKFRRYGVNLDKKKMGFRLPYPSYSSEDGFGVTFNSSFPVGRLRVLSMGFGAGQIGQPSYSMVLNRTFVDPDRMSGLITQRSVFDNRFTDSYMDDVSEHSPEQSLAQIMAPKSSAGIGTFWNFQPTDRIKRVNYSAPLQLGYEYGGKALGVGFATDVYIQDIKQIGKKDQFRTAAMESIGFGRTRIAGRLMWDNRLDAEQFWGSGAYSWLRGVTSLVYEAGGGSRIAAGYFHGADFGNPQYSMDPLYAMDGIMLRFDANMGSRRISFLAKYDNDRHRWFDQEIYITQSSGLFEPFLIYRTFPSSLKFGMTIRFGSILQNLQDNRLHRPVEITSSK